MAQVVNLGSSLRTHIVQQFGVDFCVELRVFIIMCKTDYLFICKPNAFIRSLYDKFDRTRLLNTELNRMHGHMQYQLADNVMPHHNLTE